MQLIYNSLGIFVLLVSSFIDLSISETRVVCYYTNWSVYRPGTAKFNPQNINPYLCTHLIYAFGGFTKDNQLKPFDKYQDIEQGGYAKFTGLKTYNKELKTMLAIGGWNEGSTRFSPLVASADRRAQLVKNTIKFLRQNKFDGLDLDWEYPAFRDGGKAKDRENYAKLVQELREEFDREHQKTGRPRLLLTMAVPAGFEYIDKGYDVPKLNKYLDWFNLLSYDYHSAYEPAVNHHAPLYPIEEENEYSFDNDLNINATINYYIKSGADRDKLVLGIPTYGRSYTLFNPDSNEIGAPADGPGEQGDATREKGYLAYYEICQNLKEEESDWTVVQPNPDALGPYAYNENQWVGYDDEEIVRRKSEFVVEQKLGGIMFWSIDNDDFRGLCSGKPYPLIEAAKEAYLDGLENGVQRRTKFDANKRKQTTTTTRKPDSRKSGKTTTPPPPTTPSSGSDFKCEEEGFFEHPSDCAKYFWCLEAPGLGIVAHHFSCPSGLVFNKLADSCDYARNVYCQNKVKTTTTTEAPIVWTTTTRATTTTEKASFNKVSSIYKNPSRTTTLRTTTTAPLVENDSSDLDQEDPKVIKELIELIKKAGGIEELERQITNQEEGKSDPKATTPATIINKSIVEKFKNRASLFKPRPIFNGASQAERKTEQKASTEKVEIEKKEEKQTTAKKYNAINRFSRPEPQSAGIDQIPESDAVLIEKPKYTSIPRRKPVKPDVIVENDYNNESDRNSEEDAQIDVRFSSNTDSTKKYASISRTRKPQQQVIEEEEDDEEIDEEVQTTVRTFAPITRATTNKYISLNRRRQSTTAPNENIETTEAALTQGSRSTVASRRRIQSHTTKEATTTTAKTVLDINTNKEYQIPPRNTFDITLFKNTATDLERDTLIANKHIHDDDINHIALPTESVTENISQSESIDDKVNESVNELIDGITESSDIDLTTVVSDDVADSDISEQNIPDDSQTYFTAPRPFTRSKTSQNTPPSPPPSPRTLSPRTRSETTRVANRRRPTVSRTETTEEEQLQKSPKPTYSYRPGYRGTARFRASTSKSGEYEHDAGPKGNYQYVESNRLRSLNVAEESTERPVTASRRTITARTRPTTTTKPEEESSTEARIIENGNSFRIGPDERPDRIKFTLSTGGKIDFGFNSVNSKKQSTSSSETESKLKVITGPLNKSPLIVSGREFRKGNVEEIPIQTSPETVTIQNFSEKLELSEIPLNIESFVADGDLRTDAPIEDETTVAPRRRLPSKSGFAKRPDDGDLRTDAPIEDETTVAPRRRLPSKSGFAKRPDDGDLRTDAPIEDETTVAPRRRLPSKSGFARRPAERTQEVTSTTERTGRRFTSRGKSQERQENVIESESTRRTRPQFTRTRRPQTSDSQESTESGIVRKSQINLNQRFETSSPRGFQFRSRTPETESSTAQYLTKIKVSDFQYKQQGNSIADNENSETQDVPEESTLRTFLSINGLIENDADLEVLDLMTEKPDFDDDQDNEIDYTTVGIDQNEITESPIVETTPPRRRITIRKRPVKADTLAPRQTSFSPTADYESTSSLSTTASDDDDEEYETKIETTDTTSAKPTRRVVVNRRPVDRDSNSILPSEFETSTTSSTPKKRILTIRTKTGVIKSEVEIGRTSEDETTEESIKTSDPDPTRPRTRIAVYRSRTTTTERTEQSSTQKPFVTRTRVIKRPVQALEEVNRTNEDTSESTSERPRFSPKGRRIIKVTRRPETSTTEEEAALPEAQEDKSEPSESTSARPRFSLKSRKFISRRPVTSEAGEEEVSVDQESSSVAPRRITKVLKTKKPKVLVNRPLKEEDLSVIKSEDEVQDVSSVEPEMPENNEETKEHQENEEQDENIEESPSPAVQRPTRPVSRTVTVKKRLPFGQGRSPTVHPASTRFTSSKVRITTRRFRPGSRPSSDQGESLPGGRRINFTKYRTPTTTTLPNITPHNIDIEFDTNVNEDDIDTTDNPLKNNANDISQRPTFKINRFTTSTTSKPTTLHHVFAIDIEEEDMNKLKNAPENQADEVIKKLQKLIEINRIVEVYSKEEKLKLLKNKKLKSIKAGELTLERPPALNKFGEITREVIIKLSVKQNATTTTEKPNETRSPKNIMFSETVFGTAETSTISLEGLFEREKKELELKKEDEVASPVFKPQQSVKKEVDASEITTTDSSVDDETTTLVIDD